MTLPHHIGVIVDGNRRWAKSRALPAFEGHRRGYARVKELARWIFSRDIPWVTFYAFSTENWKRSGEEVSALIEILEVGLQKDITELVKDDICVRFVGNRERFSPALQELMQNAEHATVQGTKGNLVIALNHGGRQEILDGIRTLMLEEKSFVVTEEVFKQSLSTRDLPDVDLMIRTSGEQRISNFLLWEMAYAEFYFTPVLFPDFSEKDLDEALIWYKNRERRFGGN